MRVAVLGHKNTDSELQWLASFLPFPVEVYQARNIYDLVLCWNVSPEVIRIKRRADTLICGFGVEPDHLWPQNYDPELLQHLDLYCSYRNFADSRFRGQFAPFTYFADGAKQIRQAYSHSAVSEREHDFVIFARHDPNIRRDIGSSLSGRNALLLGPLFGRPLADKHELQQRCKFEFITENTVNDWYMTEKLPQSLVSGCVPIYYGCRDAPLKVDKHLFVDPWQFGDLRHAEVRRDVIEYCLSPGVYEQYTQRIRAVGEDYLVEKFSVERTFVDPIVGFLRDRGLMDFRATKRRWSFFKFHERDT